MHSSTSSSEHPLRTRADALVALATGRLRRVFILVGIALATFLVFEFACRVILPRAIAIEAGRERDYAAASGLKSNITQPSVLLLGNSLLGAGVDMEALRAEFGSRAKIERVMVEDTLFFDWLYGMRRLFSVGSRPDLVALVIGPEQIVADRVRGEYTAYRLMRTSDTLEIGSRLGLSNTATADLYLSSMSAFLGMRNNIRRRVLLAMVPGLRSLMPRLNARTEQALVPAVATPKSAERLAEFKAMVEKAGSRLVLVVPPTGASTFPASVEIIREAARLANTALLVPIEGPDVDRRQFSDGFHLTPEGASRFTRLLAEGLRTQPPLQARLAGGS